MNQLQKLKTQLFFIKTGNKEKKKNHTIKT
jgi:hypothetical protein